MGGTGVHTIKLIECTLFSAFLHEAKLLNPHFPSIVDIQCGEKAILL